ncbi:hypothetical protein PG997_013637 [Apiospora hydei]|uniref:Uncharacterized protein n=1 Tax=Apiospora hydei TaxID=1337664 RepID=A0ABR1V9E4_9PEZI
MVDPDDGGLIQGTAIAIPDLVRPRYAVGPGRKRDIYTLCSAPKVEDEGKVVLEEALSVVVETVRLPIALAVVLRAAEHMTTLLSGLVVPGPEEYTERTLD